MCCVLQTSNAIRHVLNEERTGFELGPQSIYGLIGWTEAPYCQRRKCMFGCFDGFFWLIELINFCLFSAFFPLSAILFTNRLSIQLIHRCFVLPTWTQFSPCLEHGELLYWIRILWLRFRYKLEVILDEWSAFNYSLRARKCAESKH